MPDYEANGEDIDNYGSSPVPKSRSSHAVSNPDDYTDSKPQHSSREYEKDRSSSRSREKDREKGRDRDRGRERDKDRDREREKDHDRHHRDRHRDLSDRRERERTRDRDDDERHRTRDYDKSYNTFRCKEIMTKIERVGIETGLAQGVDLSVNQGLDLVLDPRARGSVVLIWHLLPLQCYLVLQLLQVLVSSLRLQLKLC